MQIFSSLASTQTDLDNFLTIYKENFRILQENTKANFEKFLNLSMFMQNFSSLASTQTDLNKFLTIFEENFRIFQENSLVNSKNFQT
jgi:murein L,D-transpeptidase YafK